MKHPVILWRILTMLALTSSAYAVVDCAGLAGAPQAECASGVLLDRGIGLFQKRDYADARKDFSAVVEGYPQVTGAVARARFYLEECDRLDTPVNAKPRIAQETLKFKSATSHGQILSSGEKPPSTTVQESDRVLAPATTAALPLTGK